MKTLLLLLSVAALTGCSSYEVSHRVPGAYQEVLVYVPKRLPNIKMIESSLAWGLRSRAVKTITSEAFEPQQQALIEDFDNQQRKVIVLLRDKKVDCVLAVTTNATGSSVFVCDVMKVKVITIYTNAPSMYTGSSDAWKKFGFDVAWTMERDKMLDERMWNDRGSRVASTIGEVLAVAIAARAARAGYAQQSAPPASTLQVTPNTYGLGVNSDQYGRPHCYRLQDGTKLDPIFQNNVKRNGYGFGVHQDQFGRPVYDAQP